MSLPAYRSRPPYPPSSTRQVTPSRMGAPFGYATIEWQAGGVIVESAGERRMFEPGHDLADFLAHLLGQPLDIQVSKRGGHE